MSDAAAEHFDSSMPDTPAAPTAIPRSVTLSITLHPDNQLELTGPLDNKMLATGLLGAAEAKLVERWTIQSLEALTAKAQAARGSFGGLLKRRNGG